MSFFSTIGSLLLNIAPGIVNAFLGKNKDIALDVVKEELFEKDSKVTNDDIINAIKSPSDDQIISLYKLDKKYGIRLSELGIQEEIVHKKDRQSARQKSLNIYKLRDRDDCMMIIYPIMAFILIIMTMLIVVFVNNETSNTLLTFLSGTVTGAFLKVGDFYFGSSKGSKSKEEKLQEKTEHNSR